MLDPRTILLTMPCYDGKNMAEITGTLVNCANLFAAISTPTECSHPSLVRNLIAATFMANRQMEWLLCLDNDTVPSRQDLELLLEPVDEGARYLPPEGSPVEETALLRRDQTWAPTPTRVLCPQWVDHAHRLSGRSMAELPADVLVCSEYSYKNDSLQPVKLGMGFVRIHRSVFETLQDLTHDGGPTVEVQRHALEKLRAEFARKSYSGEEGSDRMEDLRSAISQVLAGVEDKAGQPRLWQTSWGGRTFYDFYPSGPLISQFVPTAEWKGEDHGFFTLCMLAGIIPRIETRTRLLHIGRKGYPYFGPHTGGGQ